MAYVISPVATERAVWLIERQNKITFLVAKNSTKTQIKQEVEKRFTTQVSAVNTRLRPDGTKIAVVAFSKPGFAANLASKLKIL